jgi:hypothetical protein
MNAIAQTIKAAQATDAAKRDEEEARKARQLAIIESGKTRCDALVREFNETPMALQVAGEGATRSHPRLSQMHGTHSALSAYMLAFVELGMRIFLVWRGNYLVASFNAERCHSMHCRNIKGKTGDQFTSQLNLNQKSNRLMTLEDTQFAVDNSHISYGPSCSSDYQIVGLVMDDGRYTTDVSTVSPSKDRIFDLPSNFIAAVLRPMTPYLKVLEAEAEAPAPVTKPKRTKRTQ